MVESGLVKSGTRKVACMRSNGRMGSIPCAMKKGEWPVDLRMVARSAQNAKGATFGQQDLSPSHTLTMDLQMVRCCRLMTPFTWELYAEIQI